MNILVVGDIMLDYYVLGNVERISPEAPVPVLNVTRKYSSLGGCGNVIRNLTSFSKGLEVDCLVSFAQDQAGKIIEKLLRNCGCSFQRIPRRVTTIKERLVDEKTRTQLVRKDTEIFEKTPSDFRLRLPKSKYDLVLVSDYNKGVVTKNVMDQLREKTSLIIVDPKPENIHLFKGVYVITPNEKEFAKIKKSKILDTIEHIIVTKGEEGLVIYSGDKAIDIPTQPVPVYNISGAGDVLISVLSYLILLGFDLVEACKIAVGCATYSVSKPGTCVVPKKVLSRFVKSVVKSS